ncbi:hypothetical protein [Roseovarius sp. 2305UL8-3]|uniref:hypothetical protein n=1 Tax=Roseovarius conchicola TaxID=3121636 RepID=UPI0035299451
MGERQKDVSISEMMQGIHGSVSIIGYDGLPINENGLARMVRLAYELPRYHNAELHQDAVSEFRNIVEKQCYGQQLLAGFVPRLTSPYRDPTQYRHTRRPDRRP